jgi:hypothetical protein
MMGKVNNMKKKTTRGGPRPNSGRKPVTDKKVPLTIYVRESTLNRLGKEAVREIAVDAIQKKGQPL